ncbi:protein max isoform X6 [Centruroides vittatus]|uniref:protein max isoform X6 n=1 Tax=Centruroides vittatus TaxID=120091 RepID=UPI0035100B6C
MSDEDRDVDIESDEEELSLPSSTSANSLKHGGGHFQSQADKRAHHNALERKRRDHIKDSFSSLRDALPALQGEKVNAKKTASRAQILKKAAEYIQFMRRKNSAHQQDIDDLKKQNKYLEEQSSEKENFFATISRQITTTCKKTNWKRGKCLSSYFRENKDNGKFCSFGSVGNINSVK